MIEATATHALPASGHTTSDQDLALFLDMDLAILGAPLAVFDAYEDAVRREYYWAPDEAWMSGRAAMLEMFLDRPSLYHTGVFQNRFEAPARANIVRSLAKLAVR